MNFNKVILVILAIVFFCFESITLFDISTVFQYYVVHFFVICTLTAYVYRIYRKKENLLYPLLLLVSALIAGPFGLGAFLLMLLLRPIYALFASPASVWFEGLFPEQRVTLFEKVVERIRSRWDDYSRSGESSSFQNLFTYGTLSDKQKVLDAIIENFDPSYSPILKEALQDRQNVVRIQAAAIITKIDFDFANELKRLQKIHEEFPKDDKILLKLANHASSYALVGILDPLRQNEVSSLAVKYYREALQHNPEDLNAWIAIARLLFYQKDYESMVTWYEEGKKNYQFLPEITQSWYLESLYNLKRLEALNTELREAL